MLYLFHFKIQYTVNGNATSLLMRVRFAFSAKPFRACSHKLRIFKLMTFLMLLSLHYHIPKETKNICNFYSTYLTVTISQTDSIFVSYKYSLFIFLYTSIIN